MAIIIDETTRVCVQGIAGFAGRDCVSRLIESGTNVVSGVGPAHAYRLNSVDECGVPVFRAVADAMDHSRANAGGPIDVYVVIVPASQIMSAACEAFDAGIRLAVLVADRVPVWDAMRIAERARARGANFIGPGSLGAISPGRAAAGLIGGSATNAREWFRRGNVGVVGRSEGPTATCGYALGQAGIGISTLVHVGDDPVVGMRIADVALLFENDPQTGAIVVVGGVGGSQEEELAGLVLEGRFTKPIVAHVAAGVSRAGGRMIHAGSVRDGDGGDATGKIRALRDAGVTVADRFDDLPAATLQMLIKAGAVR